MLKYAMMHHVRKALLIIKNNHDYTPLRLAAKLGRKEIFDTILETRNIVCFTFIYSRTFKI
jgi:hypothetical protein